MYAVTRAGSGRAMAGEIRQIPHAWAPAAAAKAATASVEAAQRAIVEAMPKHFDRPTRYALNSLRTERATADDLSARVAVKDQAAGRATRPESFMFPQVEGGARKEKRTERALRLAGVLRPGEWVVPGAAAPLDGNGNLSGAYTRRLLQRILAQQRGVKGTSPRGKLAFFVGPVGKKGTRGVWERDGRDIQPILIFTRTPPSYRSRLPFVALADKATRDTYPVAFDRELQAIRARSR